MLLEINKQLKKLNEEQAALMATVLNIIQLRRQPVRLVVQGVAGVGKSFIIDVVVAFCHLTFLGMKNPVHLCAPTGFAASNVGGGTLNHQFKIGFHDSSIRFFEEVSDQPRTKLMTDVKKC